jgi:hypothetical protein
MSAQPGDWASGDVKEIGEAADPPPMGIGERIGIGGGGPGWHWPRLRLPRPAGIRNGALLLVLVTLAAVMALVDGPPQPGPGRRLPGIFQYLPPPVGIAQPPPVVDQPLPAAGPAAAPASDGERPLSADRAHPRRAHPRPVATARPRASGRLTSDVAVKPVRDQGGSGGARPPVTRPPVTRPPVTTSPVTPPATTTPAVRLRVPPVSARVKPPAVLGRDLPEVRLETPGATVDVRPELTALP